MLFAKRWHGKCYYRGVQKLDTELRRVAKAEAFVVALAMGGSVLSIALLFYTAWSSY